MNWKRKIRIDHRTGALSRHLTTGLVLACLGSLPLAACAEAETGPDPAPNGGDTTTRANAPARLVKLANFDQPVEVRSAPGFPNLMFVVEQPGRVMVIRRGSKVEKPFLNIRSKVQAGGEKGLLSIAFPGDYRATGRFYVYYSAKNGDIVVEELRRQSALVASPSYRRKVIRIPHPDYDNHYGGQMHFLGKNLYFGTGDGGGGNDPAGNAQNRNTLLGKMIRIDPRRKAERSYRIPSSNPLVGKSGRNEIFALGLRNPFRWSFVRGAGKQPRMAIADVGQSSYEEINYLALARVRGANFGWPNHEGSKLIQGTPIGNRIDPIISLPHPLNRSVIGGVVVRDRRLDDLKGRYLFADFYRDGLLRTRLALDGAGPVKAVNLPISLVTSFGEDSRQRVWLSSLDGGVYRLDPSS